jgi:H2-forming N5,N10-methylenetetrahydromethanopterin dehydrogenase-like enzyme
VNTKVNSDFELFAKRLDDLSSHVTAQFEHIQHVCLTAADQMQHACTAVVGQLAVNSGHASTQQLITTIDR